MHDLRGPARSMPDLALLAGERRKPGRLDTYLRGLSRLRPGEGAWRRGDPLGPGPITTMSEYPSGRENVETSREAEGRLRSEIQAVYADLARDVAGAGPVCDLSGRCC